MFFLSYDIFICTREARSILFSWVNELNSINQKHSKKPEQNANHLDELFNEVIIPNSFVSLYLFEQWWKMSIFEQFKYFKDTNITLSNLTVLEYIFCLLGMSIPDERTFAKMYAIMIIYARLYGWIKSESCNTLQTKYKKLQIWIKIKKWIFLKKFIQLLNTKAIFLVLNA